MFSTTLHVSFNIAALLNLIACLICKCSAPQQTRDDNLQPLPKPPSTQNVLTLSDDVPTNVQRPRRPTSIPGGFPRADSPPFSEPLTMTRFMTSSTSSSSKIPGQQLFAIYLISHATLYIGELLLTSLASDFPTMAAHHLVATLLFLLLATHLPAIWPHLQPSHLAPFIIHAIYWSTLTAVPAAVNDQLLALYNASLLLAACQASQARGASRAMRMGAAVAGVVVVVNYWTYCWEFKGAWCVHAAAGEGGGAVGRLREVLWEGAGGGAAAAAAAQRVRRSGGLVVVGKYGVDLEVVWEEARAWQVGVVNMWYGAGVVAMAFGLAARRD